ncbi:hypothetical protein SAMN05444167_1148 [Terriglobus roseus]|uniref:Uncharacterized protein n=1 Tax=Terriglobus roseus TaxID=392734 RepID=A0A1G7HNP6_9BACT|nr:hypothetical protein SAMN05444167_1148 [Terriglobus roseus]
MVISATLVKAVWLDRFSGRGYVSRSFPPQTKKVRKCKVYVPRDRSTCWTTTVTTSALAAKTTTISGDKPVYSIPLLSPRGQYNFRGRRAPSLMPFA